MYDEVGFPTDRLLMPLRFDALQLAADVDGLEEECWERHFNTDTYEGDWSGVALRSSGGRVSLYPDVNAPDGFADTQLLERCPNVRLALAKFKCPVTSVRFLRLGVGSRIREHRDYGLEYATGEARIHIPIISSPEVEFVLDSRPLEMRPGECWYIDVNHNHRVYNPGPLPRVHLVIDCVVDDWLRATMTFEYLRTLVHADALLTKQLSSVDANGFTELVVKVAAERHLQLTHGDVSKAIADGHLRWLATWNPQ